MFITSCVYLRRLYAIQAIAALPARLVLQVHPHEYLPPGLASRRSQMVGQIFTRINVTTYQCGHVLLQQQHSAGGNALWVLMAVDSAPQYMLWEQSGHASLLQKDGLPRSQCWLVLYEGRVCHLRSVQFSLPACAEQSGPAASRTIQSTSDGLHYFDEGASGHPIASTLKRLANAVVGFYALVRLLHGPLSWLGLLLPGSLSRALFLFVLLGLLGLPVAPVEHRLC